MAPCVAHPSPGARHAWPGEATLRAAGLPEVTAGLQARPVCSLGPFTTGDVSRTLMPLLRGFQVAKYIFNFACLRLYVYIYTLCIYAHKIMYLLAI